MKYNKLRIVLLGIICLQFSCKKFLEVEPPKNSLVKETVFKNDDQATSAILGIYANMASYSYASGGPNSITCLAGVSSDELIGYNAGNSQFYENQITPENYNLYSLYLGPYQSIYAANSILEGLLTSNSITPTVKTQLEGEALFIRAFAYFYLVNLFGPVPLQLNTDYRITSIAIRKSESEIYQQIILDLKTAEGLLTDNYPSIGRTRPNKSVVQAMLARTYLYLNDWVNAEKYASIVIGKTSIYNLVDLDSIFLSNSKEAIWQLFPTANTNSEDGNMFILTDTPLDISLNEHFVANLFEPNDNRKTSWIRSITNNTGTYYYPFKYKIQSSTIVTEYSMVLRLAEQYLIRAEARINQDGKISSGIADLNLIRKRARPTPNGDIPNPLPDLPTSLNKEDALLATEQERKAELFAEWGHRWLDLKRTNRIDIILSPIKSQFKSTHSLYPIPQDELNQNPNIKQNPGY